MRVAWVFREHKTWRLSVSSSSRGNLPSRLWSNSKIAPHRRTKVQRKETNVRPYQHLHEKYFRHKWISDAIRHCTCRLETSLISEMWSLSTAFFAQDPHRPGWESSDQDDTTLGDFVWWKTVNNENMASRVNKYGTHLWTSTIDGIYGCSSTRIFPVGPNFHQIHQCTQLGLPNSSTQHLAQPCSHGGRNIRTIASFWFLRG